MKIVYGPVASWRLGSSLGVDLICSSKKICSFNCVYCQIEECEKISSKRSVFVDVEQVVKEVKEALSKTKPDVITFSGSGEPTLAKNINEVITDLKKLTNIPLAILTNSSFMSIKEVQDALLRLDIIVAKLDAPNEELFEKINRPAKKITFENTIHGIIETRKKFKGKFALQMMFINQNKKSARDMAEIAKKIEPNEIQINTPLRPCDVKPLPVEELDEIEKKFKDFNTISVYHSPKPMTDPLDKFEMMRRRRAER